MSLAKFILSLSYTQPATEPVQSGQLLVLGGAVEITLNQSLVNTGAVGLASSRMAWAPRMLYYAGKTYKVMHHRASTDFPYGQVRMYIFDNQRGFVRPHIVGNVLTGYDSHYIPVMEIAPDPTTALDTIYVLQENLHDTPLDCYKSRASNEWSKFTELTDIGTELSYPHILRKDNGNRAIWSRGVALGYDIHITEASNKFESWGAQLRVSENEFPATNTFRHYPGVPFGYIKANGKHNLLITARNDTNEAYYMHFWVETDDTFRDYNNVEGTWTRNITTDGILTHAILASNAKYFESSGNTVNGGFPCAGMSSTGFKCVIVRGADGSLVNSTFRYFLGGVWLSKAFGSLIAGLSDGPILQVAEYLMVFSQHDIRVVVWIDDGTNKKPHLYQTTNLGDSWNDVINFGAGISADLGLSLPNNIMEIPVNENFEIQLVEVGDTGTEKTYRKVSAWNNIQAIPAVSITSAVSMNWNSTGLLHYRMRDGEITKVGNNISAATDLFGIRNATGVNSPQWDGSAFAAFLAASSRAFDVGTPASLVTVNASTVIFVGKFTAATTAHVFNMTQSSVASGKFWGFKVESSGLPSLQISDTTTFQFLGNTSVSDGNPHCIAVTVDGRGGPHMWIDGVKQYFSISIVAASPLWTKVGKGPSSVASLNVASIGRTNFTTDSYTTFSLGEIAFFSDVLPTEELLARIKMLCEDPLYNITFQTEYSVP